MEFLRNIRAVLMTLGFLIFPAVMGTVHTLADLCADRRRD